MYKSVGSLFQDNRNLLSLVKLKIDRIKKSQSTVEGASGFHPQSLENVTWHFIIVYLALEMGLTPFPEGTTQHDTRHDTTSVSVSTGWKYSQLSQ